MCAGRYDNFINAPVVRQAMGNAKLGSLAEMFRGMDPFPGIGLDLTVEQLWQRCRAITLGGQGSRAESVVRAYQAETNMPALARRLGERWRREGREFDVVHNRSVVDDLGYSRSVFDKNRKAMAMCLAFGMPGSVFLNCLAVRLTTAAAQISPKSTSREDFERHIVPAMRLGTEVLQLEFERLLVPYKLAHQAYRASHQEAQE